MKPPRPRYPEIEPRAARFAQRSLALAFASGLGLGLVISSGLIAERLEAGSFRAALPIDVAVLLASVAVLSLTSRPLKLRFVEVSGAGRLGEPVRLRPALVLLLQAAGGAVGAALAHALLWQSHAPALGWMCEHAPQLMNDAVAISGVLAAIWACASRRLVVPCLAAMLTLLLWYGKTRSHWHVDRAPFAFELTIQELVVAQVLAVASGLLAFRRFSLG